jgi:hypothetical protein
MRLYLQQFIYIYNNWIWACNIVKNTLQRRAVSTCHRVTSPLPPRLQLDGLLNELGIFVGVVNTCDVGCSQKGWPEVVRMRCDEVCTEITGQVGFERVFWSAEATLVQMLPWMLAGRQDVFPQVFLHTRIRKYRLNPSRHSQSHSLPSASSTIRLLLGIRKSYRIDEGHAVAQFVEALSYKSQVQVDFFQFT